MAMFSSIRSDVLKRLHLARLPSGLTAGSASAAKKRQRPARWPATCAPAHGGNRTGLTDVDADALKHLVRPPDFLPYSSYGSPHDLSIQGKISRYYIACQGHFFGNHGPGTRPVTLCIGTVLSVLHSIEEDSHVTALAVDVSQYVP